MPVFVPIRRILAVSNPFVDCPWGMRMPVTIAEIDEAVRAGRYAEYDDPRNGVESIVTFCPDDDEDSPLFRAYQIERIAWLVHRGWKDAISLDVGVPSLGCHPAWLITDGNHRLCAAVYMGDTCILASVEGDIDYANELFGVDVDEGYEEQV